VSFFFFFPPFLTSTSKTSKKRLKSLTTHLKSRAGGAAPMLGFATASAATAAAPPDDGVTIGGQGSFAAFSGSSKANRHASTRASAPAASPPSKATSAPYRAISDLSNSSGDPRSGRLPWAEAMLSYWSRMETARRKGSEEELEEEEEEEEVAAESVVTPPAAAEEEEEGGLDEVDPSPFPPFPSPSIIITPVRWCPTASGSQLYLGPGLAANRAALDSTKPSMSRSWTCRCDRSLRICPSPPEFVRFGSSFRARL